MEREECGSQAREGLEGRRRLHSLRDIPTELTAEHQDQLIQEAEMLQEDQDEEDINEEDEVDDMEYALDASDEGRNALIALLIAAAAIE